VALPWSAIASKGISRDPDRAAQIARVKAQVDVAHRLGITRVRHDVVEWAWRERDLTELEETFALIVPACQEIADYAAVRGSPRVWRITALHQQQLSGSVA